MPAEHSHLVADCARCAGLCCTVPAFVKSADFAITKPAGQRCHNLSDGYRCEIHARLRGSGFRGCTVFDCFGAGQQVTELIADPARRAAAFPTVLRLHELLWHLLAALTLTLPETLADELHEARNETATMTNTPGRWSSSDLEFHWDRAGVLLRAASEHVRRESKGPRADLAGADLIGHDLRRADLRGANLRGAHLIAANARGVDLAFADLSGADLRDTDVRGADLSASLFLTQPQVRAARGDTTTVLPDGVTRPVWWASARPPK